MKILFKTLSVLVAISIALVSIWNFYFFKSFSVLQDVDRETILESFKPDYDGNGLSDDAEKIIRNDVDLASKNMTKQELENFEFWLKSYLRIQRAVVLSPDKDSYLKNIKKYYISFNCFSQYAGQMDKDSLFFSENITPENPAFYEIFEQLKKKIFRFLSFDEIFKIQNPLKEHELPNCLNKGSLYNALPL